MKRNNRQRPNDVTIDGILDMYKMSIHSIEGIGGRGVESL